MSEQRGAKARKRKKEDHWGWYQKVQPKFRDDRAGEDLQCGHHNVTYSWESEREREIDRQTDRQCKCEVNSQPFTLLLEFWMRFDLFFPTSFNALIRNNGKE